MELALYHPEFGYYARAGQRSGRAGDFFTSVDVGPVFGELLAAQIAEMFQVLAGLKASTADSATRRTTDSVIPVVQPSKAAGTAALDLVEAGAGNGRLSADILRAMKRDAECYHDVRLHLVEASAAARDAHAEILDEVGERLVSSSASLPDSFEGVLLANELLDAMPVHQVVLTAEGLKEVYISRQPAVGSQQSEFETVLGPLSTPRLRDYLDRLGVTLELGWRAEINLRAVDWIRDAARRLRRGFMILIDYGHDAQELYSASHSAGTLTTFSGHRSNAGDDWLEHPGDQDITSHVDWTSVRSAAREEGLQVLGFLDQTYFLLGLLPSIRNPQSAIRNLKTLIMPGGLGSTMKVLVLGKGVGAPPLAGCSFRMRAT